MTNNEVTIEAESKKSFEQHCEIWGYSTELDADGFYVNPMTQRLFNAYEYAWEESRAALVVELPSGYKYPEGVHYLDKDAVESALDAAGVAYK